MTAVCNHYKNYYANFILTSTFLVISHFCLSFKCTKYCLGAVPSVGYVSEYQLPNIIMGINCTGEESSLLRCQEINTTTCYSGEDSSVLCQGIVIFEL